MTVDSQRSILSSEKTLFDVLREFWRAKFYLLFFGFVMAIAAFLFVSMATPYYRAEMIVGPAESFVRSAAPVFEGSGQIQRGEISHDDIFLRFEHSYAGVRIARALLSNADFVANIVSAEPSLGKGVRGNQVSAEALSAHLKERVQLQTISGTSLRRLVYYHPDQQFAKRLLTLIHDLADRMIRIETLKETNERIQYLNDALAQNLNPVHKRSLAELLMEQERAKMMVSLDQPFAARIVEPAYVSDKPRWPDLYIMYPVFIFIGLIFGFIFYGLRTS